jgi:hypothetical protein
VTVEEPVLPAATVRLLAASVKFFADAVTVTVADPVEEL